MLTLLILYLASGLLLAVLAMPLMAGWIKPNPFYGFRVPATLKDPALWYPVNAYFARRQLAVGLVTAVAAVGFYFWPGIGVDAYALACLGVFALAFGPALAQGLRYLKRLSQK